MKYKDRYAVVLAGGNGTRLWPLSREILPKQLVPILYGKNLMQFAFERLDKVVPIRQRWVCGGVKYESQVLKALPYLSNYIGEPIGRETLPAIALCSALAEKENPEAIISFFPSDHVIQPKEIFQKALEEAYIAIENNSELLITFGICPTYPSTAYGYLELGTLFCVGSNKIRSVKRFCEKPEKAIAEQFILAGSDKYLWNGGIFIWKASYFLHLLKKYEPEIASVIAEIVKQPNPILRAKIMEKVYPTIKKKSVDYGVMEPASHDPEVEIACIPLDLEWKDIGSWTAYGSLAKADKGGNISMLAASSSESALVVFQESSNMLVVSSDSSHLVACLGCEDMVVVHTADATLICPKSKVEDIKNLHSQLSQNYK
ncbi:MAG: mannose-1-phosphate guanylyltransferase [Mobilitalea sp.]